MAAFVWFFVFTVLAGSTRCWWPFRSVQTPASPLSEEKDEVQVGIRNQAKFEVANAEQKFLTEAHSYLNLSPLETCQHSVSRNPVARNEGT